MSHMENNKEWQSTLGEKMRWWQENQMFKRNKKIKTNRRWNDSDIQQGEVCNLDWTMTYLYLELQKDGYIENMTPESE